MKDFQQLIDLCTLTHQELQKHAARAIDTSLVTRNFLIGWYLVEYEQHGNDRAEYGQATLKELSKALKTTIGKGVSVDRLELMRRFFTAYRDNFEEELKSVTPSRILVSEKSATLSRIFGTSTNRQTSSPVQPFRATELLVQLSQRLSLGWSQYVTLLTLPDPAERRFYEIEAQQNQWSVRELDRQINSSLYQRLALSRNKEEVRRLAEEGQLVEKAADLIKNPLVLEFLDLQDNPRYSESDLESAIIDKLEAFLLELGKGFLFEARQKRFTFDNDHFFVDLVFYNRLLRCYVLIDLKRDKLTHQDLGQMQMYVNYFNRHVKLPDERPTIGIVLCGRRNEAVVELTLPEDANIHSSEYQLYLPTKEELQEELEAITTHLEGGQA